MKYSEIINSLPSLFEGERNFITCSANLASLLYFNLSEINWVGFYIMNKGELLLGPFCGQPACTNIAMGKGVCGTAVAERRTIIVGDVHEFPGHIACDPNSKSEIVVPIIKNDIIYGVLDIDSPILNRFDNNDKQNLELIVEILKDKSDIESLSGYYAI